MTATSRDEFVELVNLGKRTREKRSAWKKFWVGVAVRVVTGYLFMIAIGIVHNHWWPIVPAIGYWWATLLALLAAAIVGKAAKGSKS